MKLAANADVEIDTLVYSTADQQKLRAVSIPLTNAAPLFANDAGTPTDFKLLFGVAPSETTICPPAQVTVAVPPGLGWAPGAAVEFWVTTTDTGQTFAPMRGGQRSATAWSAAMELRRALHWGKAFTSWRTSLSG